MKVLVVVPIEASIPGSDLGGVITNIEQIMVGLREAGHKTTFVRLRDSAVLGRNNVPNRSAYGEDQWVIGPGTGFRMHTVLGWQGPYYTTGVEHSLQEFIDLANDHDVVIWGAMFGFMNEHARRNAQWIRCFKEVTTPAVVIINDDYFWERQAWASVVDPYIAGWAAVHHCGFDLSAGLSKPRALILNAHDLGGIDPKPRKFAQRANEVFMVQNWKSWKRGDKLVRAVPHLKSGVTLAGNGIELRYMMADEKCKPTYFCNPGNDPDATERMRGQRIWANAEACSNFQYIGAVTEEQRDQIMGRVKFTADFSDRRNTGMFNRVFIEAARQGCVTLARESFMSGADGSNKFWQAGVHYLPIEPDKRPSHTAAQIDGYMTMSPKEYHGIVGNVLDKLDAFDRRRVAQQLVSLALGKRPQNVTAYAKGQEPDPELVERGRADYVRNFGETL